MPDDVSSPDLDITLRQFVDGKIVFGRYRLTRVLGRGGMGIVWLARDTELDRDVALKFLPENIVRDRGIVRDLKRETRRSLELTHPNIVRTYDFVQDAETACISMEYVDGDTLANLRADTPDGIFQPEEIARWVSQLCDALDYAHNRARIVHRDLKPANLMVSRYDELKVADFGIARGLSDSASRLTVDRGTSGTLAYMSPQQLDGEPATPLDDIYSVGATIYELFTSKPPFHSGNIDRQIKEKIPPQMNRRRVQFGFDGPTLPSTWETLVASCLSKNPTDRPQSARDIAERLNAPAGLNSQSIEERPGRRRAAVAVVVIAACGACLLAGWILTNKSTPAEKTSSPSVAVASAAPTDPKPTGAGASDSNGATSNPPLAQPEAKTNPTHAPVEKSTLDKTIPANDFKALAVHSFLDAVKSRDLTEAWKRVAHTSPNTTLEDLRLFVDSEPALSDLSSFKIIASRVASRRAEVRAQTNGTKGQTWEVHFELGPVINDPNGWDITLIRGATEFPKAAAPESTSSLPQPNYQSASATPTATPANVGNSPFAGEWTGPVTTTVGRDVYKGQQKVKVSEDDRSVMYGTARPVRSSATRSGDTLTWNWSGSADGASTTSRCTLRLQTKNKAALNETTRITSGRMKGVEVKYWGTLTRRN